MPIEYVPLLSVQREIYTLPRGMERFREYLRTMVNAETGDLDLPLVGMNPMAKEHVPALLDRLLALDADSVAARAVGEAPDAALAGDYRATLILADDLKGGWTNRHTTEFSHRFGQRPMLTRGWIVGMLWTSEESSAPSIRQTILTALYRAAWIERHGYPVTLRDRMAQEGFAMSRAGAEVTMGAEELDYTREVIRPLLDSEDMPTTVAVLFGDAAAASLGFARQGLSPNAGLQLALREA
jgi:hypothetical protein